jgi:hypothetical protein
MIFTVVWAESPTDQLTELWLNAPDRNAIAAASHQIDITLREDPDTVGRATLDNVREYLCPPLGVEFEVIESDRLVRVLSVWRIP